MLDILAKEEDNVQEMTEPIVFIARVTLGIALLNRSIVAVKAIVHPEKRMTSKGAQFYQRR